MKLKSVEGGFQFESLIVQVVHNCCFQQRFLHQLKLEQLINMKNIYMHPSAWIPVEQFWIFISTLYQQP